MNLQPGQIISEPRIAFEFEGFACPLHHGKPHEDWCVTRVRGDLVQLVPLSYDRPVEDDDGVVLDPMPVILHSGKRAWLCTAFTITRWLLEITPDIARLSTG